MQTLRTLNYLVFSLTSRLDTDKSYLALHCIESIYANGVDPDQIWSYLYLYNYRNTLNWAYTVFEKNPKHFSRQQNTSLVVVGTLTDI